MTESTQMTVDKTGGIRPPAGVEVIPILDFGSLFAAHAAMGEIREIAADLKLDADHGVRVRVSGSPALNFEEMAGIAWDIGLGGVI